MKLYLGRVVQCGAVDLGSLILDSWDIRKYWNQNRNTRSKDVQNRNMFL